MTNPITKVLLDSDVLVALFKPDDNNKILAKVGIQQLQDSYIYVTPLTIRESATVLSHKVNQKTAANFLEKLNRYKFYELPWDVQTIKLADQIFVEQSKNRTSWPDCLNVATVKVHKLDGVFSFDKLYKRLDVDYPISLEQVKVSEHSAGTYQP